MLKRVTILIGLATLAWACGGDDDGGGGDVACEDVAAIVGECGIEGFGQAEFQAQICEALVVSDACLSAVAGADCADFSQWRNGRACSGHRRL